MTGHINIIRYVGKTNKKNLDKRLNEHINESFREKNMTHKRNWIKYVINNGGKISIRLIEETNNNDSSNREIYWITQFDNLTNTTKGGEGGHGVIYTISYDDAKKYVQKKLNIKSKSIWNKNIDIIPDFIPKYPYESFLNSGWISWGDFLGTNRNQDNIQAKNYISYIDAKLWIKENLDIGTLLKWKENVSNDNIPYFIPNRPERFYKNRGWINWGDFLGTGRISNQNKKLIYLSYNECKKYTIKNNISSLNQWKKSKLPDNIPSHPHIIFKDKGWSTWGDFFGTGRKQDNLISKNYLSYDKAKLYLISNLGIIKTQKMWKNAVKNKNIPITIPNHPELFYNRKNRGWNGWKDFLSK